MDFVITQTMSICALITSLASVFMLIVSAVKKAKEPGGKRDKRIGELERIVAKHQECLDRDLRRLENLNAGNRIMQRCMLALLSHNIDGNDVDGMKVARSDLQDYLINH